MNELHACHCCGLIQQVPPLGPQEQAACARCGLRIRQPVARQLAASRTAWASLAALILFWPAMLLPILEIEQLGLRHQSSVLGGIIELFQHGNIFVGLVVFVFSIAFPLTKLVILFELSCLEILHRRHKALTLRIVEHLGKWSMMDVMLLAFLVMIVKFGDMVEFHLGPAIVAFVLCVAMSMWASLSFDPHAIWESAEDPAESVTAGTS